MGKGMAFDIEVMELINCTVSPESSTLISVGLFVCMSE